LSKLFRLLLVGLSALASNRVFEGSQLLGWSGIPGTSGLHFPVVHPFEQMGSLIQCARDLSLGAGRDVE
jgi:hypothetical protein